MGACVMLLPNALSWVQCTVKPNNTKTSEFGVEKGLLQGCARRQVALAPWNPELLKGFQQSILKGKVREGCGWWLQTSWGWNLLSTSVRSQCSFKPPSKQILFCFCNFFSLIGMEKCYTLKGHRLENRLSWLCQALDDILNLKEKQ